jgi:hypothetical protein
MYKVWFFLLLTTNLLCQTQKPKGVFLADSIHLGEIVGYSFVFKHLAKKEVFFAEKNYNFSPFELVDKIYFPSKTVNGITTDSAIYQLRTFDLDKVQRLKLPVFVRSKNDSIVLFSVADSVKLSVENTEMGKKNELKYYQKIIPFKSKINILELFLKIASFFILAAIWWVIFGEIVKKQIKLLVKYRAHRDFKGQYLKLTKAVNRPNSIKAVNLWKKYVGKLIGQSFKSFTTTEIIENLPEHSIEGALKEIDKYIYGTGPAENLSNNFITLYEVADYQYSKSKSEILKRDKNVVSK